MCTCIDPFQYTSSCLSKEHGAITVSTSKGQTCQQLVQGFTLTDDNSSLDQALLFALEDSIILATDPNYLYGGPTPPVLVINFGTGGETLTVTFDTLSVVYSGGPVTETVTGSEFTFTHNGDLYTVTVDNVNNTVTLSKNGDPLVFDSSTGTISL